MLPDNRRALPEIRPEFEVQNYVEITGRGAFIMGQVVSGTIRIGDPVVTQDGTRLTVAAIEFADKISTREFWVCIRFAEPTPKSQLEGWFPAGSVVEFG